MGCASLALPAAPAPTPTVEPTWTISALPSATETGSATPSPAATLTPSPSETLLPTFTSQPTSIPEAPWQLRGPGEITVPILLYHHIGLSTRDEVYYLSPFAFEQQMNLLREWGYTSITVELLANAIRHGAVLPPHPVIITFDDGSETVYTTALPVMQKYGFHGSVYIVHNYIDVPNYLDREQIRALHDAGWEIGSHSLSHASLTERSERQRQEIVESRRKLQALLSLPVLSFSYPFGAYDEESVHYVHFAGYLAALGLGTKDVQDIRNIYYLYRRPVRGTADLRSFAASLPWQGDLGSLPAVTVVP